MSRFNRPLMNEFQVNCTEQRAVTRSESRVPRTPSEVAELSSRGSAVCLGQGRNRGTHRLHFPARGTGSRRESKVLTCYGARSSGHSGRENWEAGSEISVKSGSAADLSPHKLSVWSLRSGVRKADTDLLRWGAVLPRPHVSEVRNAGNGGKSDFWKMRRWKEGERGP